MSNLVRTRELQTVFHGAGPVHTLTEIGESREEHWRRQRFLGKGSYGDIWLEQCVKGHPEVELRAVKEIRKSFPGSRPIDYHRELETILQFSQRKYKRRFVESFGWYENADFIFIAMEYFPRGDLHCYLDTNPPLPELDARKITLQLLEALHFMHQNAYSHRDLKPRNVLVKSNPPDPWWVKLSDFGISKRAEHNNAATTSWKGGTEGYVAPEVLGFGRPFEHPDPQAADIWALGVMTYQMLTKEQCFQSPGLLSRYVASPDSFPSHVLKAQEVSDSGIDFIRGIMQPDPADRYTAEEALRSVWVDWSNIEFVERHSSTSTGASMQIPEEPLFIPSGRWEPVTMEVLQANAIPGDPGSTATQEHSSAASTVGPLVLNTGLSQSLSQGISIYARPACLSSAAESLTEDVVDSRPSTDPLYFILKSDNETDIETSTAHNIWCCGMTTNRKLSNRYNNANGLVFLIFSVNKSRKFCGVARMRSPWDPNVTSAHWISDEYDGGFRVEWLSFENVHFDDVRHLKYRADGTGITINDGQQLLLPLCSSTGREMMRRFGIENLIP